MSALPVLLLPPDQTNYQTLLGESAVATKLAGGASRFRADQLQVANTVQLQWDCNKYNYSYLMAFFRTATQYGSLPFLFDLINDHGKTQTYTCRLMPGTIGIDTTQGEEIIVKAVLEIAPLDPVPPVPNMLMKTGTFISNGDTSYDPNYTISADGGSLERTHSSSLLGYHAPGTLQWSYDGTQLFRAMGADDPTAVARSYIKKIIASGVLNWNEPYGDLAPGLLGEFCVSLDNGSTWQTIVNPNTVTSGPELYQRDVTALIAAMSGGIAAFNFGNVLFKLDVATSLVATYTPPMILTAQDVGLVVVYQPGAPIPTQDDLTLIGQGPDIS